MTFHKSPKAQGNGGPRKEHNKQYEQYLNCLLDIRRLVAEPTFHVRIPVNVEVREPEEDGALKVTENLGRQAHKGVLENRDLSEHHPKVTKLWQSI